MLLRMTRAPLVRRHLCADLGDVAPAPPPGCLAAGAAAGRVTHDVSSQREAVPRPVIPRGGYPPRGIRCHTKGHQDQLRTHRERT